jgi:uncharacterized membrane protein
VKLEDKLQEWEKEKLLDRSTVTRILSYEKDRYPVRKKHRLPLLTIIGLIFFTLAVFSFIAANWQVMPALLKTGLVLFLMWAFYVLGYFSEKKHFARPVIFRLIGLAMFGASIIVTAQAFHFSTSGSLLPWALFLAALAHYAVWRHAAYTVAAFIFGIFTLTASIPVVSWVEWSFFTAVVLAWFLTSRKGETTFFSWFLLFGSGLKLWSAAEYASPFWPVWTLFVLFLLLFLIPEERAQKLLPLYTGTGALLLVIYLAVRGEAGLTLVDLNWPEASALAAAGVLVLVLALWKFPAAAWTAVLGGLGFMMFDETAIALAVTAEITALAYLFVSQRRSLPLAPGFTYFILVQLVIYVIFAWGRLDMALFFLIGALLLFAFSGTAWWLNHRKEEAAS